MIRTQVQLTDEQIRRIRALATQRGVSVAQVIREAVEGHLAHANAPESSRERAVASIGGFRSGLKDVAQQHDRHLSEAFGE